MTDRQIVRDVMKLRGWSQQKLAEEAGMKAQTNVAGMLNGTTKGIRCDNLVKLLNAMGCEVVVRDKMGTKKEWIITQNSDEPAPAPAPTLEELLTAGKISFDEAVARGWKPSPEMLSKMLG